ncbi:hypothetical protein PFISCL1PPCAC_3915, partial [Pristionchus fissidentatus]
SLLSWAEAIDPQEGFLTNNSLTVDLTLTVIYRHRAKLLLEIDYTRRRPNSDDIELVVDGQTLYASRNVLRLSSSWFRKEEAKDLNKSRFLLPRRYQITQQAFTRALDQLCFTGKETKVLYSRGTDGPAACLDETRHQKHRGQGGGLPGAVRQERL